MSFGPESRTIATAVNLLRVLGALEPGGSLTLARSGDGWTGELHINPEGDTITSEGDALNIDDAVVQLRQQAIR